MLERSFPSQPQLAQDLSDAMFVHHCSAEWAADLCLEPSESEFVRRCGRLGGFLAEASDLNCRFRSGVASVEEVMASFQAAFPATVARGFNHPEQTGGFEMKSPPANSQRSPLRRRYRRRPGTSAELGQQQDATGRVYQQQAGATTASGEQDAIQNGSRQRSGPVSTGAHSPVQTPPSKRAKTELPSSEKALRADGNRADGNLTVTDEILRILAIDETLPTAATDILQLSGLSVSEANRGAAQAFRRLAKRIHPDGRPQLSEEMELQCHEALARLQRARGALSRAAKASEADALPKPQFMTCSLSGADAEGYRTWRLQWDPMVSATRRAALREHLARYEVKAWDGGRWITIAAAEPYYSPQLRRFVEAYELRCCNVSERNIRPHYFRQGQLQLCIAAIGANGSSSVLSEEFLVPQEARAESVGRRHVRA
eukprot:TRINITY_DN30923_c0_g2_i2.p1 TRINITY_DN30923_c0_g2~~TRINITY_DN30923_c0_g2_i2.p1  ORF type:complete len:429 (-),score=87.72 TRINITY_DN30923_c0_g2_i2:114-1400(-)